VSHVETPHGVRIEYDTYGSVSDPPILLVMGFGAQLIAWPAGFCARLAAGGRFVIVFDNRDCGLSSQLTDHPVDLGAVIAAASAGDAARLRELAPYTLSAMAEDGLAVLDNLGIDRAHVLGTSLGGMIAQTMAIEHPGRVRTLISMMSSTGEPQYGQSTPAAQQALFAPTPTDRAGYIDVAARSLVWCSKRYADPAGVRELAAISYDRGFHPAGVARQLAAMIVSGSRADGLRNLDVPTLVIHGLDDTLILPSGGERCAELIPGAELLLVHDMGHDRPRPLWPQLCAAILEHTG
jgi:pimeloyl-ACP methyl ester carboxylesterase